VNIKVAVSKKRKKTNEKMKERKKVGEEQEEMPIIVQLFGHDDKSVVVLLC
jgi:hypothetical protein